jgi:hypothetical protein
MARQGGGAVDCFLRKPCFVVYAREVQAVGAFGLLTDFYQARIGTARCAVMIKKD